MLVFTDLHGEITEIIDLIVIVVFAPASFRSPAERRADARRNEEKLNTKRTYISCS